MKSDYIWMDGELVPYKDATLHVLTPALHYGLGVFEGIRCYDTSRGPGVFRLQEHLERFVNSISVLGVEHFPYTVSELSDAVHMTIRANRFSECYIRPLMYMADGPLGLNLDVSRPAVSIATWEWGTYLGKAALETGVHMMVSSFTRPQPNSVMTKAKITGNYVNSALAKTLAVRSGFDEAIMLDPEGFVAECSGENLFLVRAGALYSPPKALMLEGITRDSVITLAGDLGYQVVEEPVTRDQLYIADEIFVCGTAAEVVAVREIDFRKIGSGKMGPITSQIQEAFFKTVRGEGERSNDWLEIGSKTEYSAGI
ncbi:MAG: branched-chain amino acid transaminase [Chloroflexi bacterium]|nr:MAG: branched-chain amino acid transaminase [Chloroflexota bacterium]MBL1193962.1 branched-chain amino acid transaminase [Chloroflexota bacterium]NOH11257.1 branched-chain amino acid transaminase [Chloroflexota bacterium]